jgi:voltage-gated potassium channel
MPESTLPSSARQLSPHDRRRLIVIAAARICSSVGLLLVIYAITPVESVTGADALVQLIAALAVVALVVALQVHAIMSANFPDVRAIEALIVAIAVFIVLFSLLYLGVAKAGPSNFNAPLNRVSALYFTVTVLATVGFGDITAQSDLARLLVTAQMLLDLALIAIVVRVFSSVVRARGGQ